MANYSLRQLRYFAATVDHGGIAQASRQINISQASISSAIKELESSFELQLFVRHRVSGMTLTPSGQKFYKHALQLLSSARQFEQRFLGEHNEVAGEIAVACFETLAPLYAPAVIASFQREFPGVTVRLHIAAQEKIIQGLRSGAYDVAICYNSGLPASLGQVGLLPDLYPHAVLPAGHHLASTGPVSLAMLAADPFILLDIWPSNEYFLSLFTNAGLTPNIAYHAPSLEMVRGLVGQGLGYSVLVTEPVNNFTFDGKEVTTVPLYDRLEPSRMVMAWHGSSELTHTMRQFLKHCQASIRTPRLSVLRRRDALALVPPENDGDSSLA